MNAGPPNSAGPPGRNFYQSAPRDGPRDGPRDAPPYSGSAAPGYADSRNSAGYDRFSQAPPAEPYRGDGGYRNGPPPAQSAPPPANDRYYGSNGPAPADSYSRPPYDRNAPPAFDRYVKYYNLRFRVRTNRPCFVTVMLEAVLVPSTHLQLRDTLRRLSPVVHQGTTLCLLPLHRRLLMLNFKS